MTKHEKRNLWTIGLGILASFLVIIIILLLMMLGKANHSLKSQENYMVLLVKHNSFLQDELQKKNDQIDSLISLVNSLRADVSRMHADYVNCTNALASSLKREASVAKEISEIKKGISKLSEKVDSLENGFNVKIESIINNSIENSNSDESSSSAGFDSTSNLTVKDLSFIVTKKVYNKKETKVEESEIKNYKLKRVYVPGSGWYADTLYTTYSYINENSDSVEMSFNSVANGERYYLDIRENKTKVLSFNEERTPLGAGGLPEYWDHLSWQDQFRHMEKYVNKDLQKQGVFEIAGGILIGGLGGVGYWYFDTHSRAEINVYDSRGKLIYEREISNDLGKGLSAGLIGIGTGLTAKGAIDLLNSVKISPTEIRFIQTLE